MEQLQTEKDLHFCTDEHRTGLNVDKHFFSQEEFHELGI